jgi:hypothetical protein
LAILPKFKEYIKAIFLPFFGGIFQIILKAKFFKPKTGKL